MSRFTLGLFALLCASAVWAQDPTASLSGSVEDTSGAVVRSATVSVTNLATGISHKQQVRDDGTFTFVLLPVGAYEFRAESAQFAPFVRQPVSPGFL